MFGKKEIPMFDLKYINSSSHEEKLEKVAYVVKKHDSLGEYITFQPAEGAKTIMFKKDLTDVVHNLIVLRALYTITKFLW